ncbi:hypothetical protein [Curtobacterium sp. MCJR17_020]|uniref:hypothetical protein n=1 Tax=Curtobacterium sp. MCJR17_020 TaxID=2175619 RepID=UPI0011B42518|nr:hypothetical protein [Curtobacterium sp. MCJR17_020]WIE72562.1 hypothetical protein DEJ14_002005 [Curtobacterium sp. MCJR17_020]
MEVFDTTSDERHARLAQAGVTVTSLRWDGSFASARNRALESMQLRRSGEYVLWIDSDERLRVPPSEQSLKALDSRTVACPRIKDTDFETQGVARVHKIKGFVFDGLVHEYLKTVDGDPAIHRSDPALIEHDGYSNWDRRPRNDRLLRRQIALEPENLRWRPFWVRDSGQSLSDREIARAIREQAALPTWCPELGGLTPSEYMRMIAWHGAWHLISRGSSRLVGPALSRFHLGDDESASEVLYLRLIAEAISGHIADSLIDEAFAFRSRTLDRDDEFPWLDAGVAVALEAAGRRSEADIYRSASPAFNDPFCEDSRLRPSFMTGR